MPPGYGEPVHGPEVMTTTAREQLASGLAARLSREPDVLVAYLYGSHARGTAGPGSDVDVAVLLDEGADRAQRRLELQASLGEAVDLVVLNDAPVALAYRVLRDGVVLTSRDEQARIEHWVRTVDRYLDTVPMRRVLDAGLRHRLEEGRFGRS